MRNEIRILACSAALFLASCGLIEEPSMTPAWSIGLPPPPDFQPAEHFYIPQLDEIAAEIGFTDQNAMRVSTAADQELLHTWVWPLRPSISMALYRNPYGNNHYDEYAVNFEDTRSDGTELRESACEKYLELARLIKTRFGNGVHYREKCDPR